MQPDPDFEYQTMIVENSDRFRAPEHGAGWELVRVDDSVSPGKVNVVWRRLVNGTSQQARVLFG